MKNQLFMFLLFLSFLCKAQPTGKREIVIAPIKTSDAPKTYAVVIGISKYKEVVPLQYADKDAQVFSDFLLSKSGMGLDSNNVKLFLNEKATINNIGNALSDIVTKNMRKGDRVIFFFTGHGDYDAKIFKDQALLLLYGAPHNNYFQNIFTGDFISTADLNSRFIDPLTAKGCEVLLIVDACHASGLNKSLSGGTEGGRVTMLALQNMTSPIKIYSCQANQYSWESEQWGGGRGLFSYVLMEALYGMADADNNKIVSLRELQRYLEDNVPTLAAPNKQDPIIKIEDPKESIANVDEAFLASYKAQKNKSLTFIAKANVKGGFDNWAQIKDTSLMQLYLECDSLIEKNKLDTAYEKYLVIEKTDNSSDASINLRRNLSAALQIKAASILTPMLEDVRLFISSEQDVIKAKADLQKAAALLGEKNFLYKNIQARILFLAGLIFEQNELGTNVENIIDSLELSSALEPNAPYTYYYLATYYRQRGELEKADLNLEKYLNLIPSSWWAQTNLGFLYFNSGNYKEAERHFSQAIEISSRVYESGHKLDYSKSLGNLGLIYMRQEEYSKAEPLFIQSKNIIEEVLGKENQNYAKSLYNLGLLYLETQKYTISEPLLIEAENIQERQLGKIHMDYLSTLKALNLLYSKTGQHEKIKSVDKLKMESLKLAFEKGPVVFGSKYFSECEIFAQQGNTEKALEKLEEALKSEYKNLKNMQADFFINNIRALPDFRILLMKYFTKEQLGKYPKIFVLK